MKRRRRSTRRRRRWGWRRIRRRCVVGDPGSKLQQDLPLPAALAPAAAARLRHHLLLVHFQCTLLYVDIGFCCTALNKRIHSALNCESVAVQICNVCSSSSLLGGTQVVAVRGMNSHISCVARLTSTKPRAKPPLDLDQISIKASREIGKILGHASSLSWRGYEPNQRKNSSLHCFRWIPRARANTALTNFGKN